MIYTSVLKVILATLVLLTGLTGGCEKPTGPSEEEPHFKPGEYGGDPLEDTEHLYNLQLSPDGETIALIRSRTPGGALEPRDQLWVMNADGSEPELIGFNFGGADWSPDGERLAVTYMPGAPYTYVFTVNLDSMNARLWTGFENSFFSKKTASNPRWFSDNKQLLISVWGKAYQQSYSRGTYILDTNNQQVKGPLIEIASGAFLGNNEQYFIATKYLHQSDPLSGNYIRYDFNKRSWNWISDFVDDSLYRRIKQPMPNPQKGELVYTRHIDNAWQLFLLNRDGKEIEKLTDLGGSDPGWSKDGQYIYFNRDVHKAPGARYIPHYYELKTGEIAPLWLTLPDSVPQFPPLETQDPIDFRAIVEDSAAVSN